MRRFARRLILLIRNRTLSVDPGVVAVRAPQVTIDEGLTLADVALRLGQGEYPRSLGEPIRLPRTFWAALATASRQAAQHSSGIKRAGSSDETAMQTAATEADATHVSRLERRLSRSPRDVFVREVYRYFSGSLPPMNTYLDVLTRLEYGEWSRCAFLGLVLVHGPFSADGLPRDLTPGQALLAAQDLRRGAPLMSATHIDLVGARVMSVAEWHARAALISSSAGFAGAESATAKTATAKTRQPRDPEVAVLDDPAEPLVAILGSLYKSDAYLDRWLANVEEQTIFPATEVAIVSVQPSDGERACIEAFAKRHSNVVVEYRDYPFGLYAAWNRGLELTSAPFVTNMNVDDLRRRDSLECQARILMENAAIDVVCPSVLVTLDGTLSWEAIEAIGAVLKPSLTSVPVFFSGINPPFNGPMWRRQLHEDVGLFDVGLDSAGDYEFWLRCARAGAVSFPDDDPSVVYYVNPVGLSTQTTSKGPDEVRRIWSENEGVFAALTVPEYAQPVHSAAAGRNLADRITAGFVEHLRTTLANEASAGRGDS